MKQHLLNFLLAIGAFFMPILPAMIVVLCLITIDTITGIMGARKIGEKITSRRLASVIFKIFAYELIIIASNLCETYLFTEIPFVKITLGFLAITEFYSISENFNKITGKNILKYIRKFIEGKFKRYIDEQESSDLKKPE